MTKQEEQYVQGLVAGLTQRKAYREAFTLSNRWKDSTVDSKASNLFKIDKVQARYVELLREARNSGSNMAIWTREQAFIEYEWLKDKAKEDIEKEGIKKAPVDAFLGALEGMNKMAFTDLELMDKKLIAEIKKVQAEARLAEYKAQTGDEDNASIEVVVVNEWGDDDEEIIAEN